MQGSTEINDTQLPRRKTENIFIFRGVNKLFNQLRLDAGHNIIQAYMCGNRFGMQFGKRNSAWLSRGHFKNGVTASERVMLF